MNETVCINVHCLGYQQQSKQELPLHHAFPSFHASDECQAFPQFLALVVWLHNGIYSCPSPKLMYWTTGLHMISLSCRGRTFYADWHDTFCCCQLQLQNVRKLFWNGLNGLCWTILHLLPLSQQKIFGKLVSKRTPAVFSPSFRMGGSCPGMGSTPFVGQLGPLVGPCWRSRRTGS